METEKTWQATGNLRFLKTRAQAVFGFLSEVTLQQEFISSAGDIEWRDVPIVTKDSHGK